ncbi:MAG: aldo/keto reductase [Haloarculaceae archaeon]
MTGPSPTVTLPSGDELPMVGAGTWDIHGETVKRSVRAALEDGYRHVDTAEGYHNESEIGEVLSDFDREDVFLTSKVLPKHLHYNSVIEACEASLDRLGTDYLDLYLVHWPNPTISLRETLQAMARLKERGLVRNVGVSNFSAYQLSAALHVSPVEIAVNQIEYHPWFARDELVEYCRENDVVVEAAAPLARTEIFGDETLANLAEKYDRSEAQIALKWAVEKGIVPLPKSTSPEHVRQNRRLFDWEIDDEDLALLDGLDRDHPVYDTGARDWSDHVWGTPR